jgi:hypothetical protein
MSTPAARRLRAVCAAAVVLLLMWLPGVDADDESAGVVLPGLRSDPAGSVKVSAASVVSRQNQIEVSLTVAVRRGAAASVTIQLPRFGWPGQAEPYPDRHFPELTIRVDGAPAAVQSSFEAFVGSANVTEAVRSAGVDPFAIADTPPFVASTSGNRAALEALERLGAVEPSDGRYLAKWKAARKLRVPLDPGPHTVTLRYQGRPGYALRRFDQISKPAFLATYCMAASDLNSVGVHFGATQFVVVSEQAIPVSIDGRVPQSLSATADVSGNEAGSRAVVAFCGADGKAAIGQATVARSSARTDAQGVFRVLSLGTPGTRAFLR